MIYQHKFDDSPNAHLYTGTPSNLDPNLTQVSWTNSLNAWTNYTGHTGRAIAITNTVQDTARLYLNMSVNSGYLLDVISYSFRHRSSPTGYANYNIYINNIFMGSGSIFVSSSTTLQTTGMVNVANAIAGISGTVTVRLDLYNRVGPLTQGTFRMDDFVLNGYTTALENWSPAGYRYGFQNQEKDDEISSDGNHYTALYWEFDSRLGRRWNQDPKPNPSLSHYTTFSNNPMFYTDILGDTIKGINKTSANRMKDEIKNTFKGDDAEDLRNLFNLDSDGVTMASISEDAFASAVSNLSSDKIKLAYGYYNAINSSNVHTVEMVKRSETLSSQAQKLSGHNLGSGLDDETYGGVNYGISGTSTFSIVIIDNAKLVGDYISKAGSSFHKSGLSGEILAHELLGHGVGFLMKSNTWHYQDAIQMSNLYLRVQGEDCYRNGYWHGWGTGDEILTKTVATSIPSYIQIPTALKNKIDLNYSLKVNPYIFQKSNSQIDPFDCFYLGIPPK